MTDSYSHIFINALENHDINELKAVPKADLHNHFVLGGSRDYIKRQTGIEIPFYNDIMHSMDDMNSWSSTYMGERFHNKEMRKLLIEAAFVQAREDGVKILEIGEDVLGLDKYFNNNIEELIHVFQDINQKIAPEIELRLQIGLSRRFPVNHLLECLQQFWGNKAFYSIDLYGDEFAQPIESFVPVYKRARREGLRLKAHIGEWGTPEDVKKGIELLELDEVQHGIAACESENILRFLKDNHIRLNITPTSNIKLGRVKDLKNHPIRELHRFGVDVTINSDDILIFDSDVSKEYLRLYEAETLTAKELDSIRVNGLRRI